LAEALTGPTCRLCDAEAPLVESHLLPAFVVRRFMRASPTGASRSAGNPNVRKQDYLKKPLLCADCDNVRFGSREKIFAELVDARFENRTLPAKGFPFSEELRYCAASLAWRIIVWGLGEREGEGFHDNDRAKLETSEAALRKYLLDETPFPEESGLWVHLIMAPYFTEGTPAGVNELLHATLGATIEANGKNLWVIAFMAGYLVVMVVSLDGDNFIAWTLNTALMPGWKIIPGRLTHDKKFWESLAHFSEKMKEARKPLSPRQSAKVAQRVEAVPLEKLRTNPHVFALFMDYLNRTQEEGDGK
jgi:hypothetical protein